MQFKEGSGWKACYNEEKNIYTASFSADGLKLYEINKEIFDALKDRIDDNKHAQMLITEGRKLYMEVIDRCGPPYTIVLDEDYKRLCPWINSEPVGETWPTEMTDAVVEVLECEKDNREQRRKKKEERERNSHAGKY